MHFPYTIVLPNIFYCFPYLGFNLIKYINTNEQLKKGKQSKNESVAAIMWVALVFVSTVQFMKVVRGELHWRLIEIVAILFTLNSSFRAY